MKKSKFKRIRKVCNILDAPIILKEMMQKDLRLGYECKEMILGSYIIQLYDGCVCVFYEEGCIYEEGYSEDQKEASKLQKL